MLLFAGVIVFLAMSRNLKALARFIYMSLFCVMVFLAICLFFKVTEVIFLAFLTSVFVSAILSLSGTFPQRLPMVAGIFILVLSCGWMITRIIKEDRRNKPGIANARMVIKELNRHPEILFVDAGTHFDFHISIWDTPGEYPIRNLIYNELLISNSYDQQLKRYGITDLMKEIPLKDNIYLVGEKASVLIEYYKLLYNQTVSVKKIPGFQYIDTYQIKVDNNK